MEWIRFITTGFDYDRWANRQWIDSLGRFKNMQRASEILEHILQAQRIWLERCDVEVPLQTADISLQELFGQTDQTWLMLMEQSDFDEPVTYQTSNGKEFTQPIGQIAMHVINHGTYHRGQLRQLAEADAFSNFPETDLIFYLRENLG